MMHHPTFRIFSVIFLAILFSGCDNTPPQDMSFDQLAKAIEGADSLDEILAAFPPGRVKILDNKVAFQVAPDPGYENEPLQIVTASREGDSWVVGPRISMMSFNFLSVGSIDVSGAETYSLDHGYVARNRNGYYIGDILTESLLDEAKAPKVLLTLLMDQQNECFSVGAISIGQIIGEGEYARNSIGGFAMSGRFTDMGDKNWAAFSESLSGTLHVESIEGTRFSGHYSFTANNYSGDAAQVSGKIDNAEMPCAK